MRFLCWLLVLVAGPTWAVEIEALSVVRKGRTFQTSAVFLVDVPREQVMRAATDFERMGDVNPAVVDTTVAPLASGETRVTTTLYDCVALVCRTVTLVEDVRHHATGRLSTRVVPSAGDFTGGGATWRFDETAHGTRVHYEGEIRPSFWVPRLLGTRAFKRSLRRQVTATAKHLEALSY
ncbi:MAG: SRPBCC family protein [Pseudomonadota bacterium]